MRASRDEVTSAEIVAALVAAYPPPRYACYPEMRVGSVTADAGQRMDLWILDTNPAAHFARVAFEVKVSKQDYRSEISHPGKRRAAMMLSNLFYFAVPAGLVEPDDVPWDSGLVYVHDDPDDGHGGTRAGQSAQPRCGLTYPLEAPWRDPPPPPVRFLAAVAARSVDPHVRRFAGMRDALRAARAEEQDLRRACGIRRAELATLSAEVESARRERAAHRALDG